MSMQALRERLASLNKDANAILAAKGEQIWSKEDQARFDALMDEADRVKDQIKATQRMLDADAERNFNDAARDAERANRGNPNGLIGAIEAVALYLRFGNQVSAEQALQIRNAMSTTTTTEGGYTVPSEVAKMVIDALKAYGGLRDVATVITTTSGEALSFPTSDGTAETGEILAENAAATGADITFGSAALNPYMFSSKKLALPWQLVQDSAVDIVQFVINRLATRLGRASNTYYTTGSGTAQPFGIVTRASSGKVGTTGQTLTVIHDDLVDLLHSVNRAYRKGAVWSMADSTVKVIRKIKDTAGRPIYTPNYDTGIVEGAPDQLLGYPVTVNDDIAAMAANAKSILFGDHKSFYIRDVGGYAVRRFDDSAFALNGQVGFCGWMRTGSNLLDTAAVKYYQNSAT